MVYDALREVGEFHGIADCGSFAMNSLWTEKTFTGAGAMSDEATLSTAGVMRFARSEPADPGPEETRHRAPRRTCACREIEPDGVDDGHGGEAVLRVGVDTGSTCSVACGHSSASVIAFVDVSPEAAEPRTALAVLIAGRPRAARVPGKTAHGLGSLARGAEGGTGVRK